MVSTATAVAVPLEVLRALKVQEGECRLKMVFEADPLAEEDKRPRATEVPGCLLSWHPQQGLWWTSAPGYHHLTAPTLAEHPLTPVLVVQYLH